MNSAAERYVRVLIRRPHAYAFRKKFPDAAIPGLLFLDPEGKFLGAIPLDGESTPDAVRQRIEEIGTLAGKGGGR